jgi:hypothetical protein
VSAVSASPDLTDLVSNDMHVISGGASFDLSLPYNTALKRYDFNYLSTNLSFGYEVFFSHKWSFEVSPAVALYIYSTDAFLGLSGSTYINYFFSDHYVIPYIGMGIALDYQHTNEYSSFGMNPAFVVGVVKEIKDKYYFDFHVGLPTFIGFTADNNGSRFGFVNVSVPVYFGIRYYY